MPHLSPNINNNFFEGLYKHAWKQIIPPALTLAEVDLIEELSAAINTSKILDMMCGYGRHALELARRGGQVTAIDNLQEYIDEIKLKASEQNLDITAIQSDILQVKLDKLYDAAICMGNSFSFFDLSLTTTGKTLI